MSQEGNKVKLFRIYHSEPNDFRWDYILLPYGEYYGRTADLLKAKQGDILRFFEGRDAEIQAVRLIEDPTLCTILCRMRYGIPWPVAFDKWQRTVRMEGNNRDVIVKDKCIIVAFRYL